MTYIVKSNNIFIMNEVTNDNSNSFKICAVCNKEWTSRDKFIEDPSIVFIGYQANFKELTNGLFLFNHEVCQNTLSIKTGIFKDLYKGEIFKESKHDSPDCMNYCDFEDNLDLCPEKCKCSYVREIMQLLK